MDMLDRIAAVLRALFGDAGSRGSRTRDAAGAAGESHRPGGGGRPADPDLAAAWDELNDYLGADEAGPAPGGGGPSGGDGGRSRSSGARPGVPPESLREDYANLEVPFGADSATVRRSYKRLVLRYHPDRHAGDPERLRVATEITKKVNESFERIRAFQERSTAGRGAGER